MSSPVSSGKRRINFLDFLLIILIIAVISAAIVSVIRSNPNRISGGDKEIVYTVKCEMVDAGIAYLIKPGDTIYDNETNQLLGTVKTVSEPQPQYAQNTRLPLDTIDTGKIDFYITVKAKVWVDDGMYSIDKYPISAGKTVSFHSNKVSVSGLCTSIGNTNGGADNEQ